MKQNENSDSPPDQILCEQVLISLRRIIRAVDLHSRTLLQRHGLTGPQLAVLKALSEMGEVSVGELAKRAHLSLGTLTGILDRLVRQHFVMRQRSDVDKRRVLVAVTEQGAGLIRDAPSLLQEQFLREFSTLAEWEKSQILASLQRVVAMMEADSIDATPMLATGVIGESVDQAAGRLLQETLPVSADDSEPPTVVKRRESAGNRQRQGRSKNR